MPYILAAPVGPKRVPTHVMQMLSAASRYRPASTLLVLLLAVVALPRGAAAAAAVSEDVPVPGGTVALAQALGIDPAPDRGRFIYEISRLLYNVPEGRKPSSDAYLSAARQAASRNRPLLDTRPGEVVPVPLTAELWGSAIFHRTVAPRDLITAIITDRSAALLCLGLASLDDGHPRILRRSPAAAGADLRAIGAGLRGVLRQSSRAGQSRRAAVRRCRGSAVGSGDAREGDASRAVPAAAVRIERRAPRLLV